VTRSRVGSAFSTAAALNIVACIQPVAAAVTERPVFNSGAYVTLEQSFVQQGQLWVVGKEALPPDYSRVKSAAYVLDADRGLIEKFEIAEGVTALAPWQRGFMAVRYSNDASGRAIVHVQRLDQNGRAVEAQYAFDALSYGDLHLQPEPDGDLLVGESVGEHGVLRAVGAGGEIKWERAIDRRIAEIELTDRGVAVLTEPVSNGSAGPLMIMYSNAGELLWRVSTPVASPWYRDLQFVAPDRLFVRHRMANETRLAITSTTDGELLGDISVPSLYWMRPAEDGVLLSGQSLGAPHIVRLDRTGKTLWSRRFMVQTNYSELLEAANIVAGKLIILGRSKAFNARGEELYSPPVVLISEPTGAELAQQRGYCLQLDAAQLERVQRTLREDHSIEVGLDLNVPRRSMSAMSRDCGYPTEQQLLSYHQQLLGILGDAPTNPQPFLNLFWIQVHEPGTETRLQRYHWDRSIVDAPEVSFTIATDLRAPQSVLRLVREQLQPHTIRMRAYMARFYELTQCSIAVEIGEPRLLSDSALLMQSIEGTFEQLVDLIASMPESQRRAGLQGNPHVYTQLEPGLFGSKDAMRDVRDAQHTLRMLFEQERTRARQ
jgi:hypothetical protein